MEITLIKKHLRNWWYDFRGEIIFCAVLSGLAALSFWLATYIPDEIFEIYINPTENMATATVCFFGAWILFRHAEGSKIRKAWAGILISWGCIQVPLWLARYVWGFTSIGATPEDPLYNTSITVGNTFAWLLFIYPSLVLRPGWLNWWRTLLILFPTIILCVVDYFVPANLLPLILLYPVVIFIMICSHIRKYRKWCEDNFSSMDKFDVQWIVRYLIMLSIIAISFYFICLCYVKNRMFTQQWLLFLILGYSTEQILFRKDPWAELKEEKEGESIATLKEQSTKTKEEEQGAKYEVDVNQMKLLEQWMETEKPYLDPDFQLTDLRQVLPLNRTYLSQFINTAYGCSFYQFVNNYRIKEAKRLMSKYPQAKMVDIAKHSGFSSSSVFARTFARETGTSPKEWCLKGCCLGI